MGVADTLTISGTGEINSVSPGAAVIDLADSITLQTGGAINAIEKGIEIEGVGTDLDGAVAGYGISIASGAEVTTSVVGTVGAAILVQTGADVSGGILNAGTISGATIGTNVDIDLVVGAGTDGFEDDILTAAGGITGTYDDINLLEDNLVALVVYPDANTATLLVAKTDALAATIGTVSDAGFVFLDNLQEGARRDGRVWATGYIDGDIDIQSATSESGAAGAMTVGEVETQQMRVGAGFRYAVDFGSADGIQVTPAIKLGMTQEWQNGDSSADIGFVGYTGSTKASLDFQDQTTIDLGISFDVKLSQAVTAFVGWDTALGDETTRNTGTIGLSINW